MARRQSAPRPTPQSEFQKMQMAQLQQAPMGAMDGFKALAQVIGREQIQAAQQTLNKYKEGKANLEQRIVENGKKGKATWLYIDEFHVLLNSEYSAKYLQQLWKKVRKQGGLCTGITQNVVDLLQNYTATTMLANSEFVALLKQANTDSSKMAEVIGVSEAQLRFVTNTSSGMGLIKCGSVVVPFDNTISKDTALYKLYNTNIHEKIAEQKKKKGSNGSNVD
jgi:type IV secretory pathway VirB4 component